MARGRIKGAQCDTCRVMGGRGAAGVTDGEQSQRGGGARNIMKPEEEEEEQELLGGSGHVHSH